MNNNMKFILILALSLAITSAFDLRSIKDEKQRNILIPPEESENERISNGQTAVDGEIPYQVGLSCRLYTFYYIWCGGSLIGRNWVLTAAHCMENIDDVIVYLGSTIRTVAEVTYTVDRNDVIIHADYNGYYLLNDIALIKIPTVEYSDTIQPIRLPDISSSYYSYDGYTAVASGWGRTSDNSGIATDLQWARMEVISNSMCASYLGYMVTSSNICVSTYGGGSTCKGDSGGPLVLDYYNILVGVTSFGSPSCTIGYPAAFTRVTSYLDWISYYTGISY